MAGFGRATTTWWPDRVTTQSLKLGPRFLNFDSSQRWELLVIFWFPLVYLKKVTWCDLCGVLQVSSIERAYRWDQDLPQFEMFRPVWLPAGRQPRDIPAPDIRLSGEVIICSGVGVERLTVPLIFVFSSCSCLIQLFIGGNGLSDAGLQRLTAPVRMMRKGLDCLQCLDVSRKLTFGPFWKGSVERNSCVTKQLHLHVRFRCCPFGVASVKSLGLLIVCGFTRWCLARWVMRESVN